MPSKAQRAASRQARLSRRKRRGKADPKDFQSARLAPRTDADTDDGGDDAAGTAAAPAARSRGFIRRRSPAAVAGTAGVGAAPAASAARSRRRPMADPAAAQKHLGRELRQIGMITAVIAAILAGLTFVLG